MYDYIKQEIEEEVKVRDVLNKLMGEMLNDRYYNREDRSSEDLNTVFRWIEARQIKANGQIKSKRKQLEALRKDWYIISNGDICPFVQLGKGDLQDKIDDPDWTVVAGPFDSREGCSESYYNRLGDEGKWLKPFDGYDGDRKKFSE